MPDLQPVLDWFLNTVLPTDFFARIFQPGFETPITWAAAPRLVLILAFGFLGMYVVYRAKHANRGGKKITFKRYLKTNEDRTRLSVAVYVMAFLVVAKGAHITIAHAAILNLVVDFLLNKYVHAEAT